MSRSPRWRPAAIACPSPPTAPCCAAARRAACRSSRCASPPPGDTLGDKRTLRAVALLAAAPPELRAKVSRVYAGPRGLTAPLSAGPVLYFGGADRLRAKWAAAARVLADRSSSGATYVDLRLPERPAAGGLVAPAPPTARDPLAGRPAARPAPDPTGGTMT